MIRSTILTLLLLFTIAGANAQVARWMIKPQYDQITLNNVGLFEVRSDAKIGLHDRTGAQIVPIEYDTIRPFREGHAILYKDGMFHGFTNTEGKIVDLSNRSYYLTDGADYFSCGRLVTNTVRNDINGIRRYYRYIDTEGNVVGGTYAMAYPFAEGYAVVTQFTNNKNLDEQAPDMVDVNGTPITFESEKKSGMLFVSSFRGGKAVVMIRNRFFYISPDNLEPEPISIDGTYSRKSLVMSEYAELDARPYPANGDGTLVKARNGSAFVFDRHLRLVEYTFEGREPVEVRDPEEEPRVIPEPCFEVSTDGKMFGLMYEGKELLPPQFEEVTVVEDNFAVVRSNGKYGVITIEPDSNFEFELNKNLEVSFRHQSKQVELKATLPKFVEEAWVISCSDDCIIDKSSRKPIPNVEGNFLIYQTRLVIPSDLTEQVSDHMYQFRIEYDGLKSCLYNVHVDEWYYKFWNVELKSDKFNLENYSDEIIIEFDVVKTDSQNDSNNYYKDVRVFQLMEDGTEVEIVTNTINEMRRSFTLSLTEIDRPIINFVIYITERGCPSVRFPFVASFDIPEPEEGKSEDEPIAAKVTVIQSSSVATSQLSTREIILKPETEVESSIY